MNGRYDAFRQIADDLNHMPTQFEALFRQAEIRLLKEKPQGFDVVEIGQRAWAGLPYDQWPQAFRTLFYCYWLVYRDEQTDSRMHAAALDAGTSWFGSSAFELIQSAVSCGPDENGHATEVDYRALSELVGELGLLRQRLELIRNAVVDKNAPPF